MTDNEISYRAAVRYARRHITECCYGRPCLEDCLRRLGASLPPRACAGGWRPPRWAKLLVLVAVLAVAVFAALHACADVRCIWDGDTYVCSGDGNRVEVIGGGSGDPVVVTNFWGVCTNCVAMSPDSCRTLKQGLIYGSEDALSRIRSVFSDSVSVLQSINALQSDISTFRFLGSTAMGNGATWEELTNYVFSVDNSQTLILKERIPSSAPSAAYRRAWFAYNNGIYDYAQTLASSLDSQYAFVSSIEYNAADAEVYVSNVKAAANDMVCDECQPEYEPGGPPPGGGSGGGSDTGRWCTEEQGEAIIELLGDLKTWAERQHSQLSSISNYVRSSYETLRSGLFSDYTAIPRGEDWQTLYLQGQPTGWGYEPTNILQRIEVLLYGISGISTNVSERLEDTTPSAEDTVDDVSDATASIVTDADGTSATTLGNAVVNFFRAFSPRTKNYQGGEEIIAEVSIKVGDDTHYVPAMRLGSSGFLVDTMTAVKTFVNGFCSVLFWVGGAFVIFRFWAWFSAWCIRLSKWAVELCTSLFAS